MNKDNDKETQGAGEMTEEEKLKQKGAEEAKVKTIIAIGQDSKGKVFVYAPLEDKAFCFKLLGETIKIVASSEEPMVVKPQNRFMNGIRNLRRH